MMEKESVLMVASISGYPFLSTQGMLNRSFSLRKKINVGMVPTAHVDYAGC